MAADSGNAPATTEPAQAPTVPQPPTYSPPTRPWHRRLKTRQAQHARSHRTRTGRIWWRVVMAVVVVLCLILLGTGWVGLRGIQARDHLLTAATLLRQLQTQITAADIPAARTTLATLQAETRAARSNTGDVVWHTAARLPSVGHNLGVVATIAETLDDLAHNGLPALMKIADSVGPAAMAPRDGQVHVAELARAAPEIRIADAEMRHARDRVAAVDSTGLASPVAAAVADLRTALEHAASVTATAALAATLLPPMLGEPRPRAYLVLFQNLAEPRATGGEMGAYTIVRTDHGRIEILDQGTAGGDLKSFTTPVLALTAEMKALYTNRLGIYPADVNATPHFPTVASLASKMYQLRTGHTVDAVIATDPVALSYLLAATGPVSFDGVRLTKDNAVRTLLSDVYSQITSLADQDRYFAAATRAVFDTLTRGRSDPSTALASLARAAAERRILVWSADPAEQALLAGTVLGGELPESDGARPRLGIFLNDGTGAKLGYYLSHSTKVAVGDCRPDGRRELRVAVTLGSTAPTSGLPTYVSGSGQLVPPYTLRTNLMVFSPARGAIVSATRDGASLPLGSGTERGRAVAVTTVELKPGETTTVEVTALTAVLPPEANGGFTPILWTTPGVNSWPVSTGSAGPCPLTR